MSVTRYRMVILSALSIYGGSALAAGRLWSDTTGQFKRFGDFVVVQDGAAVVREDGTNQMLRLPLDKVSNEDLAYLVQRPDIAATTVETLAQKYLKSIEGELLPRTGEETRLRGRIISMHEGGMLRVKSNEGTVLLKVGSNKLAGHGKEEWLVTKVPGPGVQDGDGQIVPLYSVVEPLQPEDLPRLLAVNRPLIVLALSSKPGEATVPKVPVEQWQEVNKKGLTPEQQRTRENVEKELRDLRRRRQRSENELDDIARKQGKEKRKVDSDTILKERIRLKNEINDLDRQIRERELDLDRLLK